MFPSTHAFQNHVRTTFKSHVLLFAQKDYYYKDGQAVMLLAFLLSSYFREVDLKEPETLPFLSVMVSNLTMSHSFLIYVCKTKPFKSVLYLVWTIKYCLKCQVNK